MSKSGEKIIAGIEDALAYAKGDKSCGRSTVHVLLAISEREGGGLQIRGLGDLGDFYVAGSLKAEVFNDMGLVLQKILLDNHGMDWVADKHPCGECHLQAGEICDICGAKN